MSFLVPLIPITSQAAGIAGGVLSTVGTAASMLGQMQAGRVQQAVMEQNARASLMQAQSVSQEAKAETYQLSHERRQMIGEQAALFGASGVAMSGSPLAVMAQTAADYERDIQLAGYNASLKQRALSYDAASSRAQGMALRKAGTIGAMTTGMGALGQSLLSARIKPNA